MSTPLFSDKVTEIFVKVDDFCNEFELEFKKVALPTPKDIKKRNRKATLTDSEVITILIAFRLEILNIFIRDMFVCIYEIVSLMLFLITALSN
jgi:hypothetical protein